LHLLILIPIAGALSRVQWYLALNGPFRFLMCLCIVYPIVCILAWPLYRYVETAGIRLGKAVIKNYVAR
jgi:peptidoglycan/LPS O-acetylase OafA/YrhL